jgi:excisionase family DNA binding protein
MSDAHIPSVHDLPELVTVPEAARVLRIAESTVYKKAKRGQLSGVVRLGGTLLIRRNALVELVEGQKITRAV